MDNEQKNTKRNVISIVLIKVELDEIRNKASPVLFFCLRQKLNFSRNQISTAAKPTLS